MPWSMVAYGVWACLLSLAMALTTFTLAGVLVRAGRSRRPSGLVALGIGGILAAAMIPLGWAVTTLTGAFGAAVLVALHGRADGDVVAARLLRGLVVWPVGAAGLWFFDEVLPVGRADEYGDHPVAWLVPFLACALCSAVALARTGAALRGEGGGMLRDVPPAPFAPAST